MVMASVMLPPGGTLCSTRIGETVMDMACPVTEGIMESTMSSEYGWQNFHNLLFILLSSPITAHSGCK